MNTVKSLAIIAVLFGGTSLAMAQGPATGGYPPVGGGAGGNPATNPGPPGPGVIPNDVSRSAAPTGTSAGTRIAPTTRHHRIYMFSRHRPMKTGQPLPKQPQ